MIRLRALLRREATEQDLIDELQFHLEQDTERQIARGMAPEDAAHVARRAFGNVAGAREQARDAWTWRWLERLRQDLRYALRAMRHSPLFALGVVATFALGIGINATMFGVVDTLFLRSPDGVTDPDRIVRVYVRRDFGAQGVFTGTGATFPTYLDLRDHVASFAQVAAVVRLTAVQLGRGAGASDVNVGLVSHQYFPMLGIRPALGRSFTDAEDRTGGDRVAVLTYRFWQQQYGGDTTVIGRALPIGRGVYTVIGIGPKGFNGIDIAGVDLFLPIHPAAEGDFVPAEAIGSRNFSWISTIALLRPGVTVEIAAAQATVAYRRGALSEGPSRDSTAQVLLGPIQQARGPGEMSSDVKVALWVAAVAAVVLLIACANVANLMLVRAVGRRRELAVRASLGAGRAGLVRLLLSEALVLATVGGISAVILALLAGKVARNFLLPTVPSDAPLVEGRVLLFTVAAVLLTTALTGIAPAVQSGRADLVADLKGGGHGTTEHGGHVRTGLLVIQIALTLVLLVGAGLFVRSLQKAEGIDLGFDADRVVSVSMNLRAAGLTRNQGNDLYLRLLDRFQQLPGVARAAATQGTPFGVSFFQTVRAEGRDSMPVLESGGPYYQAVTPGYMATMGIRVLRGRDFTAGDVTGSGRVAIVGATLAKLVWPGNEAIGKCVYLGEDSTPACTRVVGVAADAKRGPVTDAASLLYYLPLAQVPTPAIQAIFVRGRAGVPGLPAALLREVQSVGNLPHTTIEPISAQIAPQLRSWRLGASAFTAFGVLALLIAATGIFAVLSYSVSQRTKEIGVRVALGAQRGDVVRMVVGEGIRAAVIGTVVGGIGALALGRAVASLLFEVPANDPAVFGGVVVTLLIVVLAAAWLPAHRASRIAPTIALRAD